MLGKLAFFATDVPARNIFVNGDFHDELNGWTFSNAGSPAIVDGACAFTPTATPQSGTAPQTRQHICQQFSFPNNPNAKYYLAADIHGDTTVVLQSSTVSYVSVVTPYQWQRVSAVFSTSASGSRWVGVRDTKTSGWGETKVKNLMFINLTAVFGEGNEPTKDQMDELLLQFPNSWFDGTKNLFNAKYFMAMYFKKIKELENAVVSLGGGS